MNFVDSLYRKVNLNSLAFVDGQGSLTYDNVFKAAAGYRTYLSNNKVNAGDYIVVAIQNTRAVPIVFYACMLGGFVPIFMDSADAAGIQRVKDITRAKFIISNEYGDNFIAFPETSILAHESNEWVPYSWDANQCAFMLCTSATTGAFKLVKHRHSTLFKIAKSHIGLYGISSDSVIMGTPKLSFGYGLAVNMVMSAWAGATSIVYDVGISAHAIFNYINSNKVTHFFANPTVYKVLLQSNHNTFTKSLLYCISSSEPLPDVLIDKFKNKFNITLLNAYGSSETITNCCVIDNTESAGNSSIGYPIEGYQFKIVDDNFNLVEIGQPGVLMIQTDMISDGYYGTDENFYNGWYYTNDICYKDLNGEYHFVNRKNQYVKIASTWTSASEIENLVLKVNGVKDVTVAFDTNEHGLTEAVAYVTVETDLKPHEIRAQLVKTAASHLVPKKVHVVNELPRTARNKRIFNNATLEKLLDVR